MKEESSISIGEKITNFIQKNRKGIFITTGIIIFLFAGFITFIGLQDVFRKKAIIEVEELDSRFSDVQFYLQDDNYRVEINTLLSDAAEFAKKTSGYAGSKAWTIAAQIYSGREEWKQAEDAWISASKKGAKTYLGPISLFNAAVAAEEQGKYELAIEYLESCVAHQFEFPAAPRAQFSIGRLYEQLNNNAAAVEAYRAILINWQDIPIWQHLARSRITAIEVK